MKNNNKLLFILIAIFIIIVGFYLYSKNRSSLINSDLGNTELKETSSDSSDFYNNGTHFGKIKSMSKNDIGEIVIGIDFIQLFEGKDAFLALAEDFEKGNNKIGNWNAFKSKYQTYDQLESSINNMSEDQFQSMYDDVYNYELEKNNGVHPGGILMAFPNGFSYSRDESEKIRFFPINKNILYFNINNSNESISVKDLYESINNLKDAGNLQLYLGNTMEFNIKSGVIEEVDIIFQP